MGNVSGSFTPHLSGDISLNRIRAVCQRDDNTIPALKTFNIQTLANDLATLGFDIKLKDSHGNNYSNEQLCSVMRTAVAPNVERVCMMSSDKGASVNNMIDQAVMHFNKNYGASIRLTKGPGSKVRRSNAELCDDLYYVTDKLNRQLTDRPEFVKRKLSEGIKDLKKQKEMIDMLYVQAIGNLKNSHDKDKLKKEADVAQKIYRILNYETAAETDKALSQLQSVMSTLKSDELLQSQKNVDHLITQVNGMGNNDANMLQQIQGIYEALPGLALNAHLSNSCVSKFYADADPGDLSDLRQRYNSAVALLPPGDKSALAELNKCYHNLLKSKGTVQGLVNTGMDRRKATGMLSFDDAFSQVSQAGGSGDPFPNPKLGRVAVDNITGLSNLNNF